MRHFPASALGLGLLLVAFTLPSRAEPPLPVDALFERGVQALKAGRLGEAETAFRGVLQQGGNRAYVHNNLAIVYQQQGKHAEAVAESREAIRLDPAYAPPRIVLGGSLLALGRVPEATTELERAVKLLPKERLAREQLARAYARGANPGAAIEQYRALRELAPEDPEYAYQLGRAYLRLSEWAMQRLRAIDPGSARIYQALGHNYRVQLTIEGPELDSVGLLVDFSEVKKLIRGVVEYLDHRFINDLPPFDKLNPSAENIAKYFYDEVSARLSSPVRLGQVKIWETDITSATYRP